MSKTANPPTEIPKDHHVHKCNCGCMWHHENSCRWASDEVNTKAHTCPKCGREQYTIYYGDTRREFILPQLCGTPSQEPSDDRLVDLLQQLFLSDDDVITVDDMNKMNEDEMLHYIITGKKMPR